MSVGLILVFSMLVAKSFGETSDWCPEEPWRFNVFATHNIGSADKPYQSDFEGSAAAVGDVWYSSFSLNVNKGGVEPYHVDVAQYVGGNLHMVGGKIGFGGIEARGNVVLENGASVAGDVRAGGDVTAFGSAPGSIAGDLIVQGTHNPEVAARTVSQAQFQPSVNLEELAGYYNRLSSTLAAMPSTLPYTIEYGKLEIDASAVSSVAAVSISAAELQSVWSIVVNGPEEAGVVINVDSEAVLLRSIVWTYAGGMLSSRTVLNLHSAISVEIQGGPHQVTILAPRANVTYKQGLVVGTMVVGTLLGGGQVNYAVNANEIRCVPASQGASVGAGAATSATAAGASANVPTLGVPASVNETEK